MIGSALLTLLGASPRASSSTGFFLEQCISGCRAGKAGGSTACSPALPRWGGGRRLEFRVAISSGSLLPPPPPPRAPDS
eukprot:6976830-Pyramimonas_sp.AAC.1